MKLSKEQATAREAELERLTKEARSILDVVREGMTATTSGLCMYGSIIVKELIDRFTDYAATIQGGDGEEDGGYQHADGTRHGHYWVEVATPGERFIIDITHDQFSSGEPCILCRCGEPQASQYMPGNQALVDEHYRDLLRDIHRSI